jgi:hypothetical protein
VLLSAFVATTTYKIILNQGRFRHQKEPQFHAHQRGEDPVLQRISGQINDTANRSHK